MAFSAASFVRCKLTEILGLPEYYSSNCGPSERKARLFPLKEYRKQRHATRLFETDDTKEQLKYLTTTSPSNTIQRGKRRMGTHDIAPSVYSLKPM